MAFRLHPGGLRFNPQEKPLPPQQPGPKAVGTEDNMPGHFPERPGALAGPAVLQAQHGLPVGHLGLFPEPAQGTILFPSHLLCGFMPPPFSLRVFPQTGQVPQAPMITAYYPSRE